MAPRKGSRRIAYLMSWYPAVTETFILNEMLQLHRSGVDLHIFPLLGAAHDVCHPGSQELASRVHYHAAVSWQTLSAQLHWILRRPARYLRAWRAAIAGNMRSPEFLAKALLVVPRAAVLGRIMEQRNVAHVHAHWATHPALAALVIRELTGISYSFTAHAHDLYLDRSMLGEKIRAAEFVVTISQFNRALIAKLFGPAAAAKTVIIPCGVDPRMFRPRERRAPDGVLRIACVAGLRDYKGHRWLVEACRLLRARGIPFDCALVGDGPERAAIEAAIARARLGEHVRLLGNRPQQEVRGVLDHSDVFVHPSVVTADGMMDGIPVALMEAMAAEMPVISTNVSGIPELVLDGRTGLLVPEKDPASLAAALERLHRDPELALRLGRQGRRHVLEKYNLLQNASRLRAQLMRVIDGPTRVARASRGRDATPAVVFTPLPPPDGSRPAAL